MLWPALNAAPVAVGIRHAFDIRDIGPGDDQLSIAAVRSRRQRLVPVVDLDHGSRGVMAVLFLTAADWQNFVEPKPHAILPEVEHRFEIVGGKTDVNHGLGQFHRDHLS